MNQRPADRTLGNTTIFHLRSAIGHVVRNAPVDAAISVGAMILQGLGPIASLIILKQVIDAGVSGGSDLSSLRMELLLLGGVLTLSTIGGSLWPTMNARLMTKMQVIVKEQILIKAAGLSVAKFEEPDTHNAIERASQEHGRRMALVWLRLTWCSFMLMRTVSAIAVLANASPFLAVLSLIVTIPLSVTAARRGKRLFELYRHQTPARRLSTYFANLVSDKQAAPELRAYQLTPFVMDRWHMLFSRNKAEYLEAYWKSTKEGWLGDLLGLGLYAAALATIVLLAADGAILPGQVLLIILAVRLAQESLTMLARDSGELWGEAIPLVDYHRFMDIPTPVETRGKPFPCPFQGTITLENVSFAYPGCKDLVLRDVSLTIQAGTKIALVGLNGAGKSSLVKLLLGIHAPTRGRILIDGVDLQDYDQECLRNNIGCAFQDFVQYEMSLAENVAAGRPGASENDVDKVIAAMGLTDMVNSLPSGSRTFLGKKYTGGLELSGGQWQRIALARAFIRDAQILLLDEPTAALDARTEQELYAHFTTISRGRTVLLISHRLGSARLADQIVVLRNGTIEEIGSHHELMHANGHYAELFRSQAQMYFDSTAEGQ